MVVSEAEFDALVERAFEDLSEVYRDASGGLGIGSEPHASSEVLAALNVANPMISWGFIMASVSHGRACLICRVFLTRSSSTAIR